MPDTELSYVIIFRDGTVSNVCTLEADSSWSISKVCGRIYEEHKIAFQRQSIDRGDIDIYTPEQLNAAPNNTLVDRVKTNVEVSDPTSPLDEVSSIFPRPKFVHLVLVARPWLVAHPPGANRSELGQQILRADLIERYRETFIKAHVMGEFTKNDEQLNSVRPPESDNAVPEFVNNHKDRLSEDQQIPDSVRRLLISSCPSTMAEVATFFDHINLDDSSDLTTAGLFKFGHLLHVASNEVPIWKNRKTLRFGERDGIGILFYPFAAYLDVLLRKKVSYKFGTESWPLTLVVSVKETHYSYTPRSDFSVWTHNLPRLIVEVCPDTTHHNDRTRMLLQGASAVRVANRTLTDNASRFVLMAIYFTDKGHAERYFLYQADSCVYYVEDSFNMSDKPQRFQLVNELYNLAFHLKEEDGHKFNEAASKIESINASIQRKQWPAFHTRNNTKRARTDGDEGPSTTGQGGTGGGSGAQEEFEAEGYELVPDRFESGGTWEPLYKLPPGVHTVRRVGDSSGTEFIAKQISDKSSELKILEFLSTIKPPSEHVISLLETIETSKGKYILLPKRHSIAEQLRFADGGELRGRFVQLSHALAKGLAFLHEHGVAHLDIKPENLVFTDNFCLQIIDFNTAVRVKNADQEIDKYCGTSGYMAPEIGGKDGPRTMYSPIRADKWSCGRVFYLFAERIRRNGDKDEGLMAFATRLMNKDPRHRPSLLEWSTSSNALQSGGGNRLKEDKQERPETRRAALEVTGESTIPAKRRKVDTDGISANINTNDVARPILTYS